MSARPGPRGGYQADWYPYRDLTTSSLPLSLSRASLSRTEPGTPSPLSGAKHDASLEHEHTSRCLLSPLG
jgi:hypothetical protein